MNIFITRTIPESGINLLKHAGCNVEIYQKDAIIPREDLLVGVRGKDAIVSLLTDRIDEEVFIAAGPQLKIIANYAVGFDNIDLLAAKKRGIIVTNTPAPEVSITVAEHTFALMAALAHRLVESDAFTRANKYHGWSPTLLLGTDIHHKTLGIIGLGRIGREVAKRAVFGFDMHCVYHDITRDKEFENTFKATYLSFEELLQMSDFVTLHVPLLPSTRHLISTDALSLMKRTAFLINTARGPIVDEKALLRALKTNRIAGAALDVYEVEPAIDADPHDRLELRQQSNVIMTPHTGSATIEAREAMSRLAAENILAVLAHRPPVTPAG